MYIKQTYVELCLWQTSRKIPVIQSVIAVMCDIGGQNLSRVDQRVSSIPFKRDRADIVRKHNLVSCSYAHSFGSVRERTGKELEREHEKQDYFFLPKRGEALKDIPGTHIRALP